MILIYNFFIRVYYVLIYFASGWNSKAKKWIDGRKNIQLSFEKKQHDKQTIWFHCASVGEYEQALPLQKLVKKRYPQYQIFTTFFSPSGYQYAHQKYPEEWIAYLPLDTKKNMKLFVEKVNPKAVFFVKYEFWYHALHSIYIKNIPLFLVSGIFRPDQLFFKRIGFFYRKILSFFTCLFVQDNESAQLLKSIQIEHVEVVGDTRYDRVINNKLNNFEDKKINNFCSNKKIFIAGSVWNSDIDIFNKLIELLSDDWKIIIAPHEIKYFDKKMLIEPCDNYTSNGEIKSRILMIDTIGILSKIYRFGTFAYVGGGFGKGIHNILEPIVYEIPVFFGPKNEKFLEAKQMIESGVAFEISTKNAESVLKKNIFNKQEYNTFACKINSLMSINTNVSEKIIVYISKYLNV